MLTPPQPPKNELLRSRLYGTKFSAFIEEFLSNSGHFLILKNLADIVLYSWKNYIIDPSEYLLIFAMILQTLYLARPQANRFWGNLIGVGIYTLIDIPRDGWEFWNDATHLVFWSFSLIIATLQGIRYYWWKELDYLVIPLESLARSLMVLAFYIAIKMGSYQLKDFSFNHEFASPAHKFLMGSMVLIGLLLGLQTFQIKVQKEKLKSTAQILKKIAEWGLGSHVVETAIMTPEKLSFQECERTIIFIDIRGFTPWCEQTSANTVATVLNEYYAQVEPIASQYEPIRITFTADEIMVIYATPEQGVKAAIAMQQTAKKLLTKYHIGAGCAVHCGKVIEGLFGSKDVKTYTVIGDIVNTAKRIESSTPQGEIIISDAVYQAMQQKLNVEPLTPITVKGKSEKLRVWRLI